MDIVDEVIAVENDAAFDMARQAAKSDGLLVGISSGAALYAAVELAKRPTVSTLIKRNKVFPGTILFPVKELTLNFADKINMLLYSIPAR